MAEQIKYLKIENKINDTLSGDTQKNALDFVLFLQTSGLSTKSHENGEAWHIIFEDEIIGMILMGVVQLPDPWRIYLNSCDFDESNSVDDDVKEAAWMNTNDCWNFLSNGEHCGCGKQPGFCGTIFGKEFKNRCFQSPLMFVNPETKTIENIKKMLILLKQRKINM